MQSKSESLIEAVTNILVGYCINFLLNAGILPMFCEDLKVSEILGISLVFTGVSIIRQYGIRRLFNGKLRKVSGR